MRQKLYTLFLIGITSTLFSLNDPSVKLSLLRGAWKVATGGSQGKPYNEIVINGICFPGERKWEKRWNLIKDAVVFKDKRVLELGSNVALASVYALKYRGARSCTAVDLPQAQLAKQGTPQLMRAARYIHRAFQVRINMQQIDLNQSNYEQALGTDYDVVICMSFLKWVHDKERLLNFLSRFRHVIYEGHDADSVEIARFRSRGFSHAILGATHVGVSYPAEHTRTIIHFWK